MYTNGPADCWRMLANQGWRMSSPRIPRYIRRVMSELPLASRALATSMGFCEVFGPYPCGGGRGAPAAYGWCGGGGGAARPRRGGGGGGGPPRPARGGGGARGA